MRKIVITGGPCGGKTTVMEVLSVHFAGRILFVPEVASLLLAGFPHPGRDLPWSLEWQECFQRAVLAVQPQIEAACVLKAQLKEIDVLVCDRGRRDVAAYTPGGIEACCRIFGLNAGELGMEYERVIHLESVATGAPDAYGKTGNERRFETLDEAIKLEAATQAAWKDHPGWCYIGCEGGIQAKIARTIKLISEVVR